MRIKEALFILSLVSAGCTPDSSPYPATTTIPNGTATETPLIIRPEEPKIHLKSGEVMLDTGVIARPAEVCVSSGNNNITMVVFNLRSEFTKTKDRTRIYITRKVWNKLGLTAYSLADIDKLFTTKLFSGLPYEDVALMIVDLEALRSIQALATKTHIGFSVNSLTSGGVIAYDPEDSSYWTKLNEHYNNGIKLNPDKPDTYLNNEDGTTDILIASPIGKDLQDLLDSLDLTSSCKPVAVSPET